MTDMDKFVTYQFVPVSDCDLTAAVMQAYQSLLKAYDTETEREGWMLTEIPPPGVPEFWVTCTPAARPCKAWSSEVTTDFFSSSPVTLTTEPVETTALRLTVTQSVALPEIRHFSAYNVTLK
jgi:hypothetical protein